MNNRINKAKVDSVVTKMENMLSENIEANNRDKFKSADWNQLSQNKKQLKEYMRDKLDDEKLSAGEIAEVLRIIEDKAKDDNKDSIFKVLKYKHWKKSELSTTWTNLTSDLDLAQKQAAGKVNQAKVDAVAAKMEKMLGENIKTNNRDKFKRADWKQLSKNKDKFKEYIAKEFDNENLTGAEIAALSRTIQKKANDPNKDSMFKVLKNKHHRADTLSDTYLNLISDLDTKHGEAPNRIIILSVDDPDNITKQTFKAKAANAGIVDNKDWRSDDQIWLVTRDEDGKVKGKLVEYNPDNPDELTVVCTLDTDENNYNNSDLAIAKQVENHLNSRMHMIQFLPDMAVVDNKSNVGMSQKFFDELENYKDLRNEPQTKQKFALSAQELYQQKMEKDLQEAQMKNVVDNMIVSDIANVNKALYTGFKKGLKELRNENMAKINERMEKNNQVLTSLEKNEEEKLARALDIFKEFEDIEKENDPAMRTGRLLSLQEFISEQDPKNFKKSSKIFEQDLVENLGNYASKIIIEHNMKEAAVKKHHDAIKQSQEKDIQNIKVENDEDVDNLLPNENDLENNQTPNPDAKKFNEKDPLKNTDKSDELIKLEGHQRDFQLAKETLDELSKLNDPEEDISEEEKIERLTEAQLKVANADFDYIMKLDGSFKEQVIHLGKYAMDKFSQTKQILADEYDTEITPDITDNEIAEVETAFEGLIDDIEDPLVMGNTPKEIMEQSKLDHHEPINPATIFSHPKKDDIDDQQLKQNDALKNEDDDHDVNKFSSNSN